MGEWKLSEPWPSYTGDWSVTVGRRFADFPGIQPAGDELAEYAVALEAERDYWRERALNCEGAEVGDCAHPTAQPEKEDE